MTAKKFSDYFGEIEFATATVGEHLRDDPDADPFDYAFSRENARHLKREIDKAAKYLAMIGNDKLTTQHNARADKFASEIAQEWAMAKCDKCGRYYFGAECDHDACMMR